MEQPSQRSSAHAHWAGCKKSRVPWNNYVLEPPEGGVEGHRKQEVAPRTALSHAPGHEELSSVIPANSTCGAVVVDPSQETAYKLRQFCFFQYMEGPGVIDAEISGSKVARNTGKGSGLDLENVIRHLPGRDTSLRRMNSPTDVIRSVLSVSQNVFVLVMSRAFFACLENSSPILTKSSSRFIFILQGVALFVCNSTERQHRFLVAPSTLSTPASSQSNVFFCLRPKEGWDLSFTCLKVSQVRLAIIWLSLWKSLHSKGSVSKQSSTGFQASHRRTSVPRCRFRKARKAVEVIKKLCPDAVRCLPWQLTFRHLLGEL